MQEARNTATKKGFEWNALSSWTHLTVFEEVSELPGGLGTRILGDSLNNDRCTFDSVNNQRRQHQCGRRRWRSITGNWPAARQ